VLLASFGNVLGAECVYVPSALRFGFARIDVGEGSSMYYVVRGDATYSSVDLSLLSDIHLQATVERMTIISSDSDYVAL
jgi:hypothetical protein